MKRLAGFIMVFCLGFSSAAIGAAPEPPKQTGADWLLMSPQEKVQCVGSALAFLKAKGIPIRLGVDFYGAALNRVVDQPGAEKAAVVNLVTTLSYNKEPQTRPVINQLRIRPGKKKPEPAKKAAPKRRQIV